MTSQFVAPKSSFYKLLIVSLAINALGACGNQQDVVIKSGGVTETFKQGQSAVANDFENLVYPDATTAGSVSASAENDEQSKFLMLLSKSSVEAVSKWYQKQLKDNGWKIVNVQEQPKLISITAHKGQSEFNIMITEDSGATSISLSIAQQVDSTYTDENNHENDVPNKSTPPTD